MNKSYAFYTEVLLWRRESDGTEMPEVNSTREPLTTTAMPHDWRSSLNFESKINLLLLRASQEKREKVLPFNIASLIEMFTFSTPIYADHQRKESVRLNLEVSAACKAFADDGSLSDSSAGFYMTLWTYLGTKLLEQPETSWPAGDVEVRTVATLKVRWRR